jgi:hypothetical protein
MLINKLINLDMLLTISFCNGTTKTVAMCSRWQRGLCSNDGLFDVAKLGSKHKVKVGGCLL